MIILIQLGMELLLLEYVSKVTNRQNYASQSRAAAK